MREKQDAKNGNKYYIGNEYVLREDSVQNWMLSTLSVGNMVEASQSLHNRILWNTFLLVVTNSSRLSRP